MKWHKVPKFSVLGALALAPVLSMAQLTSLEDNQLHQVTGQSGIALTLEDVAITDIPDPNKPPTNGTSENFIELFSEGENGNGLSLALTNLSIGGYNPDGSRGGWTLGTVSDPLFIIVPSITRLDRPGQDTNGDGTTTYPVLSLGTPSYATTQNQAAYIELTWNFYQENIETFSYNAAGDLVANGDPSAVNIYDTLQHNLSRLALQNVILNGAQYGDGYDEYRITNVNLWAKNGDLNIVARVNLEADLDIVPAYSLDYIGGEANVSPNKKSAFADVGYAPILNADGVEISDADYNFDDPTTAPNHTGFAIRGLKADLALGRVFYQPLTLGIASRRGDLKVELAQIPGGFVCQPTDPSCSAADTVSIDDPINALAKDFYSDPLSKSQVSWDHAYMNGEYIGGAEINDLRIHYLNLTTCASATDVASCN